MELEEVNKIIAEFDGWKFIETICTGNMTTLDIWEQDGSKYHYGSGEVPEKYTESLDALVPVWEKLRLDANWRIKLVTDYTNGVGWSVTVAPSPDETVEGDLRKAAAIATAKAILELK